MPSGTGYTHRPMSEDNSEEIQAIGSVISAAIDALAEAKPDDPETAESGQAIRYALVNFINLTLGLVPGSDETQEAPTEELEVAGNQLLGATTGLVDGLRDAGLTDELKQLNHAIAGTAVCLVRADAGLTSIEPVANAFVAVADETSDSERLTTLGYLMDEVLSASKPGSDCAQGSESSGPWRDMNLRLGHVATRTQDTELMQSAFERMAENIPEDLPAFFRETMDEMERAGYPDDVQAVIRAHHDRWV